MVKKLILLVLIALLATPAITGCSCNKEQPAAPAASAAVEEKPANQTSSPTPTTTPPEKVSENPGKAIPLTEFVEQVKNNEYEKGDIVLISGIVESAYLGVKEIFSTQFERPADGIFLGTPTVRVFRPEICVILSEQAKVKIGDEVIVKGTFVSASTVRIEINKAVVQQ